MLKEITTKQFWELYKKLPEELQEALFSTESSDFVYELCKKNNIKNPSDVVEYMGDVLIGFLPPKEFQETLEKKLNIETEIAKDVARGINRFVFLPVRPFLERLYETETTQFTAPSVPTKEKIKTEKKPNKDKYREPIE